MHAALESASRHGLDPLTQRQTRPEEPALERAERHIQNLRDLLVLKPLHVPKDQQGPLLRRKIRQSRVQPVALFTLLDALPRRKFPSPKPPPRARRAPGSDILGLWTTA